MPTTLEIMISERTSLQMVSNTLDPLVFASKNDKNMTYMGKESYDGEILRMLYELGAV